MARAAHEIGVQRVQVPCPCYFEHSEGDFEEFVRAAAAASPGIGIIACNTFWTSAGISFAIVDRLSRMPGAAGPKRANSRTDAMEFEDVVRYFRNRLAAIDNNLQSPMNTMPALGVRAFEVHACDS